MSATPSKQLILSLSERVRELESALRELLECGDPNSPEWSDEALTQAVQLGDAQTARQARAFLNARAVLRVSQ